MDISVIIPSYKPGEYVWECLESLNRQTLAKDRFEVIFVLNGCNEPWKSDLQKWFDAHPELNVNFIQTDTPGVSNARNIALSTILKVLIRQEIRSNFFLQLPMQTASML